MNPNLKNIEAIVASINEREIKVGNKAPFTFKNREGKTIAMCPNPEFEAMAQHGIGYHYWCQSLTILQDIINAAYIDIEGVSTLFIVYKVNGQLICSQNGVFETYTTEDTISFFTELTSENENLLLRHKLFMLMYERVIDYGEIDGEFFFIERALPGVYCLYKNNEGIKEGNLLEVKEELQFFNFNANLKNKNKDS